MAEEKQSDQAHAIAFVATAAAYWSDIDPPHPAADYLAGQVAETR